MTYSFECASCGRTFTATQPTATTCSGACRERRRKERAAAQAVAAAALLRRQTALVIRMTATDDDAERSRLLAELDELAREALATLPAAA